MKSKMKNEAFIYVQNLSVSRANFAREVGLNVEWLNKFMIGKFDDPGVSKIEKILNHKAANTGERVA